MTQALLNIDLRTDADVVVTRQRTRQVAALLGLSASDQTALATAASEVARNAQRFAGGGSVAFSVRTDRNPAVVIRISDRGPGINDVAAVLEGKQQVPGGAPNGMIGARRLVDEFDVASAAGVGTTITIAKRLPPRGPPVTPALIASLTAELSRHTPRSTVEEVQEQNRELMRAFDELRQRQTEVERLNAELAETNRGVLALYAELDEKAESLRRASELKTRFLSDVTHELRTPLNAVISLSQLLLDRIDGELTGEQERQVSLIHRSASGLNDMVSDLLDIARIEAGKIDLHVETVVVADVLGALRGMFRPLMVAGVRLNIEEPHDVTIMSTDERKLTQVLRNLLSNAAKFTERGEVSVRTIALDGDRVAFIVTDTGIGIGETDLARIFADFSQVDSPLQRVVRGTGLGLPLTRKLSRLLGGDVAVTSTAGVGSTFTVTLPRCVPISRDEDAGADGAVHADEIEGGVRV